MSRKIIFLLILVLAACTVDPAERNNAGNRLSANGEYGEAVIAYQAAQVAEPDNPVIYFNSANALVNADRLSDAERSLQLVIEQGDEELIANAWYNLGNIYFEVGNIDEAILAYQEALLVNPYHDNARYNLELANSIEIPPSPTAIEMQSELNQENIDEQATPTPNPAGQIEPTPSPTPRDVIPPPGPSPENIGDEEMGERNPEPSTPDPFSDGDVDTEDAAELLEQIETNQEHIGTFRENYNETGEQTTGQDW